MPEPIAWVYDDGGRAAAGYRGETNDCVTRAIAIATGRPYAQVYDTLFDLARLRQASARTKRHGSPRSGVHKNVYEPYLTAAGFEWTPTMQIGTGCRVHLRADELPGGTLIVRLSRHIAAVKDGVLHDTFDCSRDGTRCVYGYWRPA